MRGNIRWWLIFRVRQIQFGMAFLHSAQLLYTDCGYPRWSVCFTLPNAIFFYMLFNDFYKVGTWRLFTKKWRFNVKLTRWVSKFSTIFSFSQKSYTKKGKAKAANGKVQNGKANGHIDLNHNVTDTKPSEKKKEN